MDDKPRWRLRIAAESAGVTFHPRPSPTTGYDDNTVPELESSWKQGNSHSVICASSFGRSTWLFAAKAVFVRLKGYSEAGLRR
ncbi:hypothetical protein E4T56_gene20734 [Termitomyces sp. T112]|nr:hypothetical protein E4T56_gene20734 [Termitomyces sp. T112]